PSDLWRFERQIMIFRVLRSLLKLRGRSKSKVSSRQRRLSLEPLEGRRLLTLLGITPGFPLIFFDSTGRFEYSAGTHTLDISATPLSLLLNGSSSPTPITSPADVELHILVDNSGNLIGGNGIPNFEVTGTVVINGSTDSGTLVTG